MAQEFEFSAATVDEQGRLVLTVSNIPKARQFVLSLKNGKSYIACMKEKRNLRSLTANGYFWVLCDKLAESVNESKEKIYQNAVRDIGGNRETVCIMEKAAPALEKHWTSHGLGWVVERTESKLPGCVNMNLYYGSSQFDTAQMARLIDNIVQDCKAVGIETLPPDELERLKREWA